MLYDDLRDKVINLGNILDEHTGLIVDSNSAYAGYLQSVIFRFIELSDSIKDMQPFDYQRELENRMYCICDLVYGIRVAYALELAGKATIMKDIYRETMSISLIVDGILDTYSTGNMPIQISASIGYIHFIAVMMGTFEIGIADKIFQLNTAMATQGIHKCTLVNLLRKIPIDIGKIDNLIQYIIKYSGGWNYSKLSDMAYDILNNLDNVDALQAEIKFYESSSIVTLDSEVAIQNVKVLTVYNEILRPYFDEFIERMYDLQNVIYLICALLGEGDPNESLPLDVDGSIITIPTLKKLSKEAIGKYGFNLNRDYKDMAEILTILTKEDVGSFISKLNLKLISTMSTDALDKIGGFNNGK